MARVAVTSNYYAAASGTADYYGSGAYGRYIPAVYSKKTLRRFLAETVFQDICNRDYEGEIKKFGDTVYIRKDPAVVVNDYSIGGTLTYDTPKEDAVEMVINKAKYTAFKVDDIDRAQSDMDLVNLFAKNTKREIAIKVDQEIMTYMATGAAAGNSGATAGAISGNINLGAAGAPLAITKDNAINLLTKFNQVLDETNAPPEQRWVVVPAWFCTLLKDGDLKRSDVTGDATGVIRTGLLGTIDGLRIYRNNNLYSVTDGTTARKAYYILAGCPEACTFAAQIDKSDSLQIPTSFGVYWRTLFVWGRLITQPKALAVGYCEPSAA